MRKSASTAKVDEAGVLGRRLNYQTLQPHPLKWIETEGVPLSYKGEDKIRLSKDKKQLRVNLALSLAGSPPESFQYRLGNRSALDWVIQRYRLITDKRSGIHSDPNCPGNGAIDQEQHFFFNAGKRSICDLLGELVRGRR